MATDADKAEKFLNDAVKSFNEGFEKTAEFNALVGIGWAILALRKTVQYKL